MELCLVVFTLRFFSVAELSSTAGAFSSPHKETQAWLRSFFSTFNDTGFVVLFPRVFRSTMTPITTFSFEVSPGGIASSFLPQCFADAISCLQFHPATPVECLFYADFCRMSNSVE